MTDNPITLLKERLAKAEAKKARHKKLLEAAEAEVSDVQTALRVFNEVMNPGADTKSTDSNSTTERQLNIAMMLGDGKEHAKAPVALYPSYTALFGDDINIDTFRTTIWRMKDRKYDLGNGVWVIEGDNGLYWKRAYGNLSQIFHRAAVTNHNLLGSAHEHLDDDDQEIEEAPF